MLTYIVGSLKDRVVAAWKDSKRSFLMRQAIFTDSFHFLRFCKDGLTRYGKSAYHLTMDTQTAISKAGGVTALSKLLGISRAAIYQWGASVPEGRFYQLKVLRPEWFE